MSTQSIIDTRRHQMFPTLEPAEIERLRRFGEVRSYGHGPRRWPRSARWARADHHPDRQGRYHAASTNRAAASLIVTHGPGSFMGELAQLSGRPALVDAHAQGPVEALIIPPDRLRALLVAEAELGERIMRALILRRVGLHRDGSRRPGDRRPRRERRRAAAGELPAPQRPSASAGSIPTPIRRRRR